MGQVIDFDVAKSKHFATLSHVLKPKPQKIEHEKKLDKCWEKTFSEVMGERRQCPRCEGAGRLSNWDNQPAWAGTLGTVFASHDCQKCGGMGHVWHLSGAV